MNVLVRHCSRARRDVAAVADAHGLLDVGAGSGVPVFALLQKARVGPLLSVALLTPRSASLFPQSPEAHTFMQGGMIRWRRAGGPLWRMRS
jgi:hypothetical protein